MYIYIYIYKYLYIYIYIYIYLYTFFDNTFRQNVFFNSHTSCLKSVTECKYDLFYIYNRIEYIYICK